MRQAGRFSNRGLPPDSEGVGLAWGYTPYKVKGRKAPPGAPTPGLPKFLMGFLCLCACVFIFAVVSEVLGTPRQEHENLMIRLDSGGENEEKLLVDPSSEWKSKDGAIERKYRILWKKPAKRESTVSLWDEPDSSGKKRQPDSTSDGKSSWDQAPEKKERPEGW